MTLELLLFLGIALVGICLSAMYSGMETGIYTLNRVRLGILVRQNSLRARMIDEEVGHPNRLLATLLVGNNIANYLGTLGLAAILELAGLGAGLAVLVNTAILVPLLFVFAETMPKELFRTHTDRWTYFMWRFLRWSRLVLTWIGIVPLIQLLGYSLGRIFGGRDGDMITARQRMSWLIHEGAGSGAITGGQAVLAERALTMREITVGSLCVRITRAFTIGPEATESQLHQALASSRFSHVPVVGDDGRVIGVISTLKYLRSGGHRVDQLMEDVPQVSANTPVLEALQIFRGLHMRFGIVTDSGQPIGFISITDLLEPLTGPINDV